MVTDGTLLKVYAWYDNEIGYVCRVVISPTSCPAQSVRPWHGQRETTCLSAASLLRLSP